MIKRKLFAEKFKSIFNTKSWPWKSEFCYLSTVPMDFLQTSFQNKSSTALFIILISGQCCILVGMPNLSFKSWTDSNPSVIWYGDKEFLKGKSYFLQLHDRFMKKLGTAGTPHDSTKNGDDWKWKEWSQSTPNLDFPILYGQC